MKLAKDCLDPGLYTNRRDEMLAFWQQRVGVDYEECLRAGGGVHQHRHGLHGSVYKLNHARERLPDAAPSGYREWRVAVPGRTEVERMVDPDGNRVALVPPGHEGIQALGVHVHVRDEDAFHVFYRDVLELEPAGPRAYRAGTTLLSFERDPGAGGDSAMFGSGYRYVTFQVWDCDAEHAGILARGGREGRAPLTLGRVARISFVRDPDGNWIEISQRGSLTGSVASSSEG